MTRRVSTAKAELSAANAAVAKAVSALPPLYVETADAKRARIEAKPIVDRAQAASTQYLNAVSELINLRDFAAIRCARRKS